MTEIPDLFSPERLEEISPQTAQAWLEEIQALSKEKPENLLSQLIQGNNFWEKLNTENFRTILQKALKSHKSTIQNGIDVQQKTDDFLTRLKVNGNKELAYYLFEEIKNNPLALLDYLLKGEIIRDTIQVSIKYNRSALGNAVENISRELAEKRAEREGQRVELLEMLINADIDAVRALKPAIIAYLAEQSLPLGEPVIVTTKALEVASTNYAELEAKHRKLEADHTVLEEEDVILLETNSELLQKINELQLQLENHVASPLTKPETNNSGLQTESINPKGVQERKVIQRKITTVILPPQVKEYKEEQNETGIEIQFTNPKNDTYQTGNKTTEEGVTSPTILTDSHQIQEIQTPPEEIPDLLKGFEAVTDSDTLPEIINKFKHLINSVASDIEGSVQNAINIGDTKVKNFDIKGHITNIIGNIKKRLGSEFRERTIGKGETTKEEFWNTLVSNLIIENIEGLYWIYTSLKVEEPQQMNMEPKNSAILTNFEEIFEEAKVNTKLFTKACDTLAQWFSKNLNIVLTIPELFKEHQKIDGFNLTFIPPLTIRCFPAVLGLKGGIIIAASCGFITPWKVNNVPGTQHTIYPRVIISEDSGKGKIATVNTSPKNNSYYTNISPLIDPSTIKRSPEVEELLAKLNASFKLFTDNIKLATTNMSDRSSLKLRILEDWIPKMIENIEQSKANTIKVLQRSDMNKNDFLYFYFKDHVISLISNFGVVYGYMKSNIVKVNNAFDTEKLNRTLFERAFEALRKDIEDALNIELIVPRCEKDSPYKMYNQNSTRALEYSNNNNNLFYIAGRNIESLVSEQPEVSNFQKAKGDITRIVSIGFINKNRNDSPVAVSARVS